MESILEQQRRYHEERERLLDAMVKEMLLKKTSVSFSHIFVNLIRHFAGKRYNYCIVSSFVIKSIRNIG